MSWIKGPQQERRVAERKLELEWGRQRSKAVLEARDIRFRVDRRLCGKGKNGWERKPLQLPAARVAGLQRSRWTQENCLKCMRVEFGLDSLPERALEEVDEKAWVVSPAWRAIEKALKKERHAFGCLRRQRAAEDDAGKAHELDERIRAWDEAVAGLVRAGALTEERRLQALPEPLRVLTDTLRMIACRAETAMTVTVAPEPGNPDTVRSLLKALFRTDATLPPDPAAGTLTGRLLHQSTHARDAALAPCWPS